MKKLIALILIWLCIFGLTGCVSEAYELPQDKFCYSADGAQTYELSADDMQYIIDLLNNASWVKGLSNCSGDVVFHTQKQEVGYHSECGTFNDYTSKKSMTVSKEHRDTINEMLGIN